MRKITFFLVVVLALGVPTVSTAAESGERLSIRVLSNRADLVSGGDALVQVVLPAQTDPRKVRVTVDGRDVTPSFALRPDGRFLGIVTGLQVGQNMLKARGAGGSAQMTITNHPIGGPVFSGPQVEPWRCETQAAGLGPAMDADCNAASKVEFFYKSSMTGQFRPYDRNSPPADLSYTTTDRGDRVPYIVRRELGTINRAIYAVAVLAGPGQSLEPWATNPGWNHKLYYLFEGGAAPNHRQGNAPFDVLRDIALSRGFAVATSTLNTFGQNSNSVTSAETVMMLKEHVIEQFGEIRYTMSTGCSGGSIQQHLIAGAYPGLLDGIEPSCSYMDIYTTNVEATDCSLLGRYYNQTSPHLWTAERQRASVNGHVDVGPCRAWDTAYNLDQTWMDPRVGCLPTRPGAAFSAINPVPQIPEADYVYDPQNNPGGVRCTLHDYQVAMFGERPPAAWGPVEQRIGHGFANRPFDNVGVQYGLRALESGEILPEQFVDLNEHIGGYDIDMNWQPGRSMADPYALKVAYRTGQVTHGRQLANVPIIDLRGSSNHEIHTDFRSYSMRHRLIRANGHADNQIIWTTPAIFPDPKSAAQALESAAQAFVLMDKWLANIEADSTDDPLSVKVLRNKPASAADACWIAGKKVTDIAICRATFPYFGDPRIAAGGPMADDVLKCQLKPLNRNEYNVDFTNAQWKRLLGVFPSGVCDYRKPGVSQQATVPWLTFSTGPGGTALGSPPTAASRHDGEAATPARQ